MNDATPSPLIWRVLAAFAIAPAVAAFALACYAPLYGGIDIVTRIYRSFFLFLVVGAYPLTVLFGVPAYAFLKYRVRPTLLNCAITGAVVPLLPWLIIGLFMGLLRLVTPAAITARHVSHMTSGGLFEFAKEVGPIALAGLLAGGVFWVVAAAGVKRPAGASPVET